MSEQRYPPEVLSDSEVRRLLDACGKSPTGLRNRALLAILYRCGLRISEALALMPSDYQPSRGVVHVRRGKGGKRRTVGIDAGGAAIVDAWAVVRNKRELRRGAPLLCTLKGHSVDSRYVRDLLPRLKRRAGLDRRIHAHAFRHTFASQLAAEGVPTPTIQAWLGHSSLATTSRYLAHVAPQDVIAVAQARDWAA